MRVLVLVGWHVFSLERDDPAIRQANKIVRGKRYWFFQYMPADVTADVVDIPAFLEETRVSRLGLHNLLQSLKVMPVSRRYDVVLSHHAGSGLFLAGLRRVLGRKSPPHVILDVGLPGFVNSSQKARLRMLRYALGRTNAIIYHARVQDTCYRMLGIPNERLFFLPFGIDPTDFVPSQVQMEDHVISVGDGQRDYPTLVEASRLLDTGVKIVSQRYDLKEDSLPANVTYYGYTPISEVKRMIASSRMVVLPLHDAPVSCGHSVLLQAMSMSKAVVASRVPGIADYVVDGETALLCEPGSAHDMAEKIGRLLNDPEEAERLGNNARKAILADFTEEKMAQGISQVLASVTRGDGQ
jgi:glycosyltransferase involved in cell wall biosynthesis